ncbi:MAG TPA: hypothetical protein VGO47_11935, partial [Chlamydiales bacterium]|nr:hypothetical protein [Chlamydiales bacterium]
FCVNQWNRAQLRGDVKAQIFFGTSSAFAEYLFWLPMFYYSLKTLFQEDVDRVLDTQVMGTSATIKALRLFNRAKKKNVFLEKVLVDLPTKKATHFFKPIRKLNAKDRQLLRLITITPMLEKEQTAKQFWEQHCKLDDTHLQYEDYFVRRSFATYRTLERRAEPFALKTRFQNPDELEYILQSIERGKTPYEVILYAGNNGEIRFIIDPKALVFTILLGSQPANNATLNYVLKCLQISGKIPVIIFVFCSKHETGQASLLRKVSDAVHQCDAYPTNLTIVPMSFQNDDVIAPLFFRSNMTCTRSGGQTAMELMSVSKGEIWIHSEAKLKKFPPTEEELLTGIPGWESANAAYLQHVRGAKIVTTDTFGPLIKALVCQQDA